MVAPLLFRCLYAVPSIWWSGACTTVGAVEYAQRVCKVLDGTMYTCPPPPGQATPIPEGEDPSSLYGQATPMSKQRQVLVP